MYVKSNVQESYLNSFTIYLNKDIDNTPLSLESDFNSLYKINYFNSSNGGPVILLSPYTKGTVIIKDRWFDIISGFLENMESTLINKERSQIDIAGESSEELAIAVSYGIDFAYQNRDFNVILPPLYSLDNTHRIGVGIRDGLLKLYITTQVDKSYLNSFAIYLNQDVDETLTLDPYFRDSHKIKYYGSEEGGPVILLSPLTGGVEITKENWFDIIGGFNVIRDSTLISNIGTQIDMTETNENLVISDSYGKDYEDQGFKLTIVPE